MRILVADGDCEARRDLSRCLRSAGHEVPCADGTERAWDALQTDAEISLLVAGSGGRGVDGPELCRRVRRTLRDRYLPILLVASRGDADDLVRGLRAGADAFLSHPVREAEVLAQIGIAERILDLQQRLEARLHDLSAARERLERHLRAAAQVQCSLLPSEPPRIPGLEFAWLYEACELVAGDMFNVFRLDETHAGLYVLDVSGHGTSAALLSVNLSRLLTPFAQQGGILKRPLSVPPYYEVVPPAEVAAELNRRFQLIQQSGQFFTLLYGVVDLERRELRYVRAGHPPPIHVTGGEAQALERGGDVPIGIVEDARFGELRVALRPGDAWVVYSDGLSETRDARGVELGAARLREWLSARTTSDGLGAAAAVEALRKGLSAFRGAASQRDDVTLLALGVEPAR